VRATQGQILAARGFDGLCVKGLCDKRSTSDALIFVTFHQGKVIGPAGYEAINVH